MLEQEIASIIKYVLDSTGNPSPYYYKIPQSFVVPSIYFPEPEIVSGADTLSTYSLEYAWYISIFAKSDADAYALGLQAVTAIRSKRNLIPLIDTAGGAIKGDYVRINDPSTKMLDNGACQLSIDWISRRPYYVEAVQKMQTYEIEGWAASEIYSEKAVTAAMEAAVESYLTET